MVGPLAKQKQVIEHTIEYLLHIMQGLISVVY